jgi:hypothetical protein
MQKNHLSIESVKDGVFSHLAWGHIAKHVATKELLALCQHLLGQVAKRLSNTLSCLEGVS